MASLSRARLLLALLGAGCLSAASCASRGPAFAETVEGTLTWGNTPLVGVRVQFVPQLGPEVKAPLSSATTDDKGFFRLTRDDTGKPGAVLGKHKVVLRSGRLSGPRSRDDEQGTRFGSPVPDGFTRLETTTLEVEVKAEQKTYPLKLLTP
jgi:hypothetical protein